MTKSRKKAAPVQTTDATKQTAPVHKTDATKQTAPVYKTDATKKTSPVNTTDALAKWEAESGQEPVALLEIRLDQNERFLVPFTNSVGSVQIHYLDFPSFRGSVSCNGAGCLLCQIGRQREARDLLPVYDVLAKAVGVLAVSENLRPQALRPQLMPVLRQLKDGKRVLLAARKPDRTSYRVAILDLPDDADAGEEEIARFQDAFERGDINLASIYQQLSDEAIATIPEVATSMKLMRCSR